MGNTGVWDYWYNINNGRYINDDLTGAPKIWDNTNWITKEEYKEPEREEYKLPLIQPNIAFEDEFGATPF